MTPQAVTLLVCSLADAPVLVARRKPSHVLSLVSPETEVPRFADLGADRHIVLKFHDVAAPTPDFVAPDLAAVRTILEFGSSWDGAAPLLVHCWAGISRSTAAAYALACQFGEKGAEHLAAKALRRASPVATPNPLIVQFADELLGRDGAMVRAVAAIGRGSDALVGKPFDLTVLV